MDKQTLTELAERDYAKEYKEYHGKKKQIKRRASRNSARRKMKADGKAKDGDERDVDHIDGNPLNNHPSNLRVVSQKTNRSKKSLTEALHIAAVAQALVARAQTDAPNYKAHSVPEVNCGTCTHFVRSTECDLFSFAADADYVCDRHQERTPNVGQVK